MLKAPDSAIGKKGRCKGCGREVEILPPVDDEPEVVEDESIPDLAINIDEEDAPLDPRIAPPAPVSSPTMPPEPFYYGFLVFYALSCVTVAVIQFALVLIYAMVQVQESIASERPFSPYLGASVLASVAWMLGIILVSCPILLAVDATRNVRAMRYGVK